MRGAAAISIYALEHRSGPATGRWPPDFSNVDDCLLVQLSACDQGVGEERCFISAGKKCKRMADLTACSRVQSRAAVAALPRFGSDERRPPPTTCLPCQHFKSPSIPSHILFTLPSHCLLASRRFIIVVSQKSSSDRRYHGTTTYGVTAAQGTVHEYSHHHVSSSSP